LAAAIIAALAVATFLPFKFLHPMRVTRLRAVTLAALVIWSLLAAVAMLRDLDPGPWVAGGLVVLALYFVGVGLTEKR
jgi:phosphatidylcholine synthase